MKDENDVPALELKPVDTGDPDVLRIYELTLKSVQNLNNYIADFFESIKIMMENREVHLKNKDFARADEMLAGMEYIQKKIEEVSRSMEAISETMPELVLFRKGREKEE